MQPRVRALFWRWLDIASQAFSKAGRLLRELATRLEPEDLQQQRVEGSTRYDMVAAPDEPYYAEQYWEAICPYLLNLPTAPFCLDLGCSQGRFSIKLAKRFPEGRVLGCDISEQALVKAKQYAESERVTNLEFQRKPINEFLACIPGTEIADVIFMTEVTFFYPDWKTDFPRIVDLLKPSGILAMSFRSQYYDGLCIVKNRLWENADLLLTQRKGRVFGGSVEFTWQQSTEIRTLFSEKNALRLLDLVGIGCCSGIPGDPHDMICQPSRIGAKGQEKLMELELALGPSVPDAGRYILAIGKKI